MQMTEHEGPRVPRTVTVAIVLIVGAALALLAWVGVGYFHLSWWELVILLIPIFVLHGIFMT